MARNRWGFLLWAECRRAEQFPATHLGAGGGSLTATSASPRRDSVRRPRHRVRRGGLEMTSAAGLWGYNNSDTTGNARLTYASLVKEGPQRSYVGLLSLDIHFAAAAVSLWWLPVGLQPARPSARFHLPQPSLPGQRNPRKRSSGYLRSGQSRPAKLLTSLRFASLINQFLRQPSLRAHQEPGVAGIEPTQPLLRSTAGMMSSARRAFSRNLVRVDP